MNIWDWVILQPMLNVLIVLSYYLMNNFGITIILFTIIIRLIILPLSLKQLNATKSISTLQPKLMELQRKYAKDRAQLAKEQMNLYKESGISPTGCAIPMIIQMPIWIALYQAIMLALAVTPEGLLNLAKYLYSWPISFSLLPLQNQFLWLDLATGDTVLAVLVGASMFIQQKMVTPTATDPRQASQNRMMLWMMPIMFTFFSLSFPSGLALYWVISNVFSIVLQYYVTGWGGLSLRPTVSQPAGQNKKYMKRIEIESTTPKSPSAAEPKIVSTRKEGTEYGKSGDTRPDIGGSQEKGFGAIRRWFRRD